MEARNASEWLQGFALFTCMLDFKAFEQEMCF